MELRITSTTLADGRELIYFDYTLGAQRVLTDSRDLPPIATESEMRRDPLTGDWVVFAAHRMNRTFMPPANENPLAPTTPGQLPTEIPSPDYDVVVFENRFPSLIRHMQVPDDYAYTVDGVELFARKPALARCEVVCFTSDPSQSFRDLTVERIRTVIEAWTHRTAALSALPGIAQVFPFENRGEEIGVTLQHPHGQIYSFPDLTPRMRQIITQAQAHDGMLFEEVLQAERRSGKRIIHQGAHFTVFVPAAAKWPMEVMVLPHRQVADFTELSEEEKQELTPLLKRLYTAVDRFFDGIERTPYIAAWNQAPVDPKLRPLVRFHLQIFSLMRSPGRMKFLAGVESAQGAWMNDTTPELIANRFKEIWN